MDTNLGEPAALTIEPALQVYRRIIPPSQFMSISGNDQTVILALAAGVPAIYKGDGAALRELTSHF
jgi:hypothetical protein